MCVICNDLYREVMGLETEWERERETHTKREAGGVHQSIGWVSK